MSKPKRCIQIQEFRDLNELNYFLSQVREENIKSINSVGSYGSNWAVSYYIFNSQLNDKITYEQKYKALSRQYKDLENSCNYYKVNLKALKVKYDDLKKQKLQDLKDSLKLK